jgi:hypothetical protein
MALGLNEALTEMNTRDISWGVKAAGGHAGAQWLRHCAANRKVAGSMPDGVIGIFD